MDIAQVCKSVYNNQLQQSIYICHKRKMPQIWQVNTLWKSKTVTPLRTPTSPNQCPYQLSTFYTLWNPRNSPDKILKLMVTMTRLKVKSKSHHDIAHLQPLTNATIKYQLPIPYGFRDIAQTRFYRSRSLRKGQRPNQSHTMTLHTYTWGKKWLSKLSVYTEVFECQRLLNPQYFILVLSSTTFLFVRLSAGH